MAVVRRIFLSTPGPQGDQGPAGPTGATGDAGATGATGPGVAAGGADGQVLAKASAADYDTEWVNPADSAAPTIESAAGVPGTTPDKIGDIYIDTTNDVAYLAVGTSSSADWEKVGGGVINLNDYSGTDDQRFAAAIAAVPVEGAQIFVPAGSYEVSTSITLPKQTYLIGEGRGTKISLADGANTAIVSIVNDNCGVAGIWFDGNQSNNTTSIGVNVYGAWTPTISDCYFEFFGSQAIQASGTAPDKTSLLTVRDVRIINGNGDGVKTDANCQDARLSNVYVEKCATAFNIQSYGMSFTNCHAYDSTKGWYFGFAGRCTMLGCFSEGHGQQGIQVDSSDDIQITDCHLFNNSTENPWYDAIYVGGTSTGIYVRGAVIYDDAGNTRHGVHFDSGTSGCWSGFNTISDTSSAAVQDSGTGNSATLSGATFTGNVVVPDATADGEAIAYDQDDARLASAEIRTAESGADSGALLLTNTNAGADLKTYRVGAYANGTLVIRRVLDSGSAATTAEAIIITGDSLNLSGNDSVTVPDATADGHALAYLQTNAKLADLAIEATSFPTLRIKDTDQGDNQDYRLYVGGSGLTVTSQSDTGGTSVAMTVGPDADVSFTAANSVTIPAATAANEAAQVSDIDSGTGQLQIGGYEVGDTGWRDISSLVTLEASVTITRLWARRIGGAVHVRVWVAFPSTSEGSAAQLWEEPINTVLGDGFRPRGVSATILSAPVNGATVTLAGNFNWHSTAATNAAAIVATGGTMSAAIGEMVYATTDAWPSTLPGSAV